MACAFARGRLVPNHVRPLSYCCAPGSCENAASNGAQVAHHIEVKGASSLTHPGNHASLTREGTLHRGRTTPVAAAAFVDRPDLRARSPSSRPTQAGYALLRNSGLGRTGPSRVVAETCCGVSDPRDGRPDLKLNRLDAPKSSSVSVLLHLLVAGLILSRFQLIYYCVVRAFRSYIPFPGH